MKSLRASAFFTASVAALALTRHVEGRATRNALEPFRQAIIATLNDLADALDQGRAPRSLPELDAPNAIVADSPLVTARIGRMSRQVKTLHDSVERIVGR